MTKKRSDTLVKTLRATYGDKFAAGHTGDIKLSTLLERTGNAVVGEFQKHKSLGLVKHKTDKVLRNKNSERISDELIVLVANASVRFGAALKKLADK